MDHYGNHCFSRRIINGAVIICLDLIYLFQFFQIDHKNVLSSSFGCLKGFT